VHFKLLPDCPKDLVGCGCAVRVNELAEVFVD
jgi:hypothetical protein